MVHQATGRDHNEDDKNPAPNVLWALLAVPPPLTRRQARRMSAGVAGRRSPAPPISRYM